MRRRVLMVGVVVALAAVLVVPAGRAQTTALAVDAATDHGPVNRHLVGLG